MTFAHWTRWPAHEQVLWLTFGHALRCSMEFLRHFRDLNAATLMAHFGVVPEESIFNRLQERGMLRVVEPSNAAQGAEEAAKTAAE